LELVAVAIPVETMAVVTSITSITIISISFRFSFSGPLATGTPDSLSNIAVVSGSVNFIIFSRGSFFSGPLATKTLRASVRIRSGTTGVASNTISGSREVSEGRCRDDRFSDMSDMMSIDIRVVKAIGIGMVTVESISVGFSRRLSGPFATAAETLRGETGTTN